MRSSFGNDGLSGATAAGHGLQENRMKGQLFTLRYRKKKSYSDFLIY
jgi:hypothetical protein